MRHLKCIFSFAAVVVLGLWQSAGLAQSATATGTVQQLASNLYQYNLTLTNTSTTTPIGSFWFGWIPGYDLLPHVPSSVGAPAGWSGVHMEEGLNGGSSVLWTAATPLQPGQSLSGFTFQTSDSPSVLEATSPQYPLAADFSYVYSGAPEASPFAILTPSPFVTATPEPAGILLAPGMLLLMRRRSR